MCGFCAQAHSSESCPFKNTTDLTKLSCANGKINGLAHTSHSTFCVKCPSYVTAQSKLKATIPYYGNIMRM